MSEAGAGVDWNEMASSYARQSWLEWASVRRLLDLLAPSPCERMLDVATGPATLLSELAGRAERPRFAVGIDSSPRMLAAAPALPAGWQLQEADAERLPFGDAEFDVVGAAYLLHVLGPESRARVIAECARVLRPGGRLGVITIAPPRGRLTSALSAPLRAAAARSQGRLAGLNPLDPGAELAAAGLREIAREHSYLGYPALCLVHGRADPGAGP